MKDFGKISGVIRFTIAMVLKLFGFGSYFINIVEMFYKEISSSVIINMFTSQRFSINRGVRQGCPISPFLFILVTELLSLSILRNHNLKGITICDREIKISQLADDTTLFFLR
ncbi:MAG: reverse transcriptase domain-containing protein [Holosporales bacterium]